MWYLLPLCEEMKSMIRSSNSQYLVMSCCLLVVSGKGKHLVGGGLGGKRLVAKAVLCGTILIIGSTTVTLSFLSLLMVLLMFMLTAK